MKKKNQIEMEFEILESKTMKSEADFANGSCHDAYVKVL